MKLGDKMKALVTGGSGFLGRHIVNELVKENIETVVYDQVPFDIKQCPAKAHSLVKVFRGDVLDFSQLEKAMDGCDIVFHTAAIAEIDEARKNPVRTMEVNVLGTVNCLEMARQNGINRFLYASSVYVSGNRGSFYRVSKQTGESLCKTYSDDYGLAYTILRYGSLYGRDPNHWNFIYGVCRDLLTKGEFFFTSSPDAIREYIHISDAARETVRISREQEFINKSVLITGHQRLKMKEFFDMIEEILGKEITIHYAPSDQQRHYIRTPYSFDTDVPIRINLSTYVDISEGILDCLKEIQKELNSDESGHT
jgi:UDP-glucose 4-epimerase